MLNIPLLYSSFSGGVLCAIQTTADTRIHRHKPLPDHDDFWVKDQGQHIHTEIMQGSTMPERYRQYTNL